MFDRTEALAGRDLDILVGDVVLKIDERLALAARHAPDGLQPIHLRISGGSRLGCRRREANLCYRLAAKPRSVPQRVSEGETTGGAAGDGETWRQRPRHKGLDRIVPS